MITTLRSSRYLGKSSTKKQRNWAKNWIVKVTAADVKAIASYKVNHGKVS